MPYGDRKQDVIQITLFCPGGQQLSLFEAARTAAKKNVRVSRTADAIRRKFGNASIRRASSR